MFVCVCVCVSVRVWLTVCMCVCVCVVVYACLTVSLPVGLTLTVFDGCLSGRLTVTVFLCYSVGMSVFCRVCACLYG